MTPALRLAGGMGLAALAAALVVADPLLSPLLPEGIWHLTGLTASPIRLTPLLVLASLAVALALPYLRGLTDFSIAATGLLFVASQMNGFGAGPFDLFDLALGGVFLTWIARRMLDETRPLAFPPLTALSGLLLILAIAHLAVESPARWFIGTFGIARAVLVAFLVLDLLRDAAALSTALEMLRRVALISAGIGIVQFVLAWLGLFVLTLIEPPISAFKPTPIGFVMRASGLCITAQHYSSFLVYALPFALWRLTEGWRLRDVLSVLVLLTGILVSWNFGAMIAAMLVAGLLPFLRWPSHALHLGLGIVALFAAAWFTGLAQLAYDLSFGDAGVAKGVSQRHTLFELGLDKIARNPWVGTGPQAFAYGDGNFWGRPVHNAFGQAATELGVFGAILLAMVFLHVLAGLAARALSRGPLRGLAAVAFLMVLAALQLAQSEPNLDHTNTWMMLGIGQALLLIARRAAPG